MLQGLRHLQWRHSTASWLRERFCSTVESLSVLRMEHFAMFSTLLLHFLHISPCPAPQQNEGNCLIWRNILPVSRCLFNRLEGSHFGYRNIPPGCTIFSLVILAACGQFCYSITLQTYCLVLPSPCVFWTLYSPHEDISRFPLLQQTGTRSLAASKGCQM